MHKEGFACLQAKASACDQHQALEAQEARRGLSRDASTAGLGSMDWRVRLLPTADMPMSMSSLMRVHHNAHAALVILTSGLSANSAAWNTLSCLQSMHSVVWTVMRKVDVDHMRLMAWCVQWTPLLKTYCIASETNAVSTLFLSVFFWAFLSGEPVRSLQFLGTATSARTDFLLIYSQHSLPGTDVCYHKIPSVL